jgi:hypothetical protein
MAGKIGDHVRVVIDNEGCDGYVIGAMAYGSDVLCVADEKAVGMPVNTKWCAVLSSGHETTCERLRARYVERFPNTLAQ